MSNVVVKVFVPAFNPLFHHTTGYLPIVVVEGKQFTRILRNPYVDIGEGDVVF